MQESSLFISYGNSDVGRVRTNNEDSYLYKTFSIKDNGAPDAFLMVVADGMGGHAAGEVASAKVIEELDNNIDVESLENLPYILKEIIAEANEKIFQISAENSDLNGMGTTCTAMIYYNEQVHLAHVGDSRAYLIREKEISRLSKDHTVVQELLEAGTITEEKARTIPERNILLRAVGTSQQLEVDVYPPLDAVGGDIFLLCSDGLTEYLYEEEIQETIASFPLENVCDELIRIANDRGGADNITVQLAMLREKNKIRKARQILKIFKNMLFDDSVGTNK
ncbi:MAG: Stp1/IreP family PP2C-type Ser/Thr phosphatase [Candidatus Dadabacteria bacterium]|nr:Stp1/IreP family PP2C-type Ser/Thr phosphatase [Candidatus Dadabacteria bacterium]NIS09552.1 Stp1/IreP family PP2C-type Ser/Thr phosphatase [Candidatus Dadabacteria bacterium]NIV43061.1 Stp1/IreP family PP2C-type Ser/Thr phosphatase [Candidatus Dadabacteria bacterium]NIX16026.1 Stp1/IreP family PP2C-type Ser/Thr phosphatase [Candidatus Dadabacteria bacterium]NIY22729.1 Stp1/IreP family PP2C-type Ser/Thr phosphatase [Candidatus Dadabacteria bacterium]